jgi:hypothetical protein
MADTKKRWQKRSVQPPEEPKFRASRISGYLAEKPKPIKAFVVNPAIERKHRIWWWLKWVIILPLCALAFSWLVLILVDLFK